MNRRGARSFGALLVASLVMVAGGCSSEEDGVSAVEPFLKVYLAAKEPTDQCTVVRSDPGGGMLHTTATPLLTDAHVRRASRERDEGLRPALVLEMTDKGADLLEARADEYVDRMLAFVWNGRVIYAPWVRSPMSRRLMVVGGTPPFPEEELEVLHEALNASVAAARRTP